MAEPAPTSFVAECFWPGVREDDLRDLDGRVNTTVAGLVAQGDPVRYLGSMLIIDDEVVLCLFEGPLATVRLVAQRAGLAFERILRSTRAPWPARPDPDRPNPDRPNPEQTDY